MKITTPLSFEITEYWHNFSTSVACNIISSTLFLFLIFYLLRPRIKISEKIAREVDSANGNTRYFFKICNKSFYRAYDLKIELYQVKIIQSGGHHIELADIEINKSVKAPPCLQKYEFKDRFGKPKNNQNYEFAMQFKTLENIEPILKDTQRLIRVHVEARHGLTGLQSIFIQEYDEASCIISGVFESGRLMNIK